jgi:hypothetical protein
MTWATKTSLLTVVFHSHATAIHACSYIRVTGYLKGFGLFIQNLIHTNQKQTRAIRFFRFIKNSIQPTIFEPILIQTISPSWLFLLLSSQVDPKRKW